MDEDDYDENLLYIGAPKVYTSQLAYQLICQWSLCLNTGRVHVNL